MSALLPPIPDLIPISVLRTNKGALESNNQVKYVNNNNVGLVGVGVLNNNNQVCAPCNSTQCVRVMGEQRSRRRKGEAEEAIDTPRSRGACGAAPRQAAARKTRKSERRRERGDRRTRRRSASTTTTPVKPQPRESLPPLLASLASPSVDKSHSPERPRVNPIFVWVRQEDTHIVEVKCEDYDKRNRILLTKTAQGWRAIPRTETLVPTLQKTDDTSSSGFSEKSQKSPKSRTLKRSVSTTIRRRSTAVQVNNDFEDEEDKQVSKWPSAWSEPINVETHLPSHTIFALHPNKVRSPHLKDPEILEDPEESQEEPEIKTTELDEFTSVNRSHTIFALNKVLPPHLKDPEIIEDPEASEDPEIKTTKLDEFTSVNRSHTIFALHPNLKDPHLKDPEILEDPEESQESEEPEIKTTELDEFTSVNRSHTIFALNKVHPTNLKVSETLQNPQELEIEKPKLNEFASVNSENNAQHIKASDVSGSPLDNLLAVAELEFNQQIQAEAEWNKSDPKQPNANAYEELKNQEIDVSINDMDQLEMFIEACAPNESTQEIKDEEDEEEDYVEDEEQIHMDDILSRLELSLQSPVPLQDCDLNEIINNCAASTLNKNDQIKVEADDDFCEIINCASALTKNEQIKVEVDDDFCEIIESKPEEPIHIEDDFEGEAVQDTPTDLSTNKTTKNKFIFNNNELLPTDLSIRRISPPLKRPQSSYSETIQSPQPSGIPAPSPDLCKNQKTHVYLESLLSPNKAVSLIENKEPLDLGKARESDSPKVTCSQQEEAPPAKKMRIEDITLKKLLHNELKQPPPVVASTQKITETPRLLELLTTNENDPYTQFKHVLCDPSLDITDPMLVPAAFLNDIVKHPAKEIPKLLQELPDLRYPDALYNPKYSKDNNIYAVPLLTLQAMVFKESMPGGITAEDLVLEPIEVHSKEEKTEVLLKVAIKGGAIEINKMKLADSARNTDSVKITSSTPTKQSSRELRELRHVESGKTKKKSPNRISELSADINDATTAAFSQMLWLPYLNQLESAAMFGGSGNPDFMKVLGAMVPGYAGAQMQDFAHMMGGNQRLFPMQAPPVNYNPLELGMWQEAMMQANLMRNKNQYDLFNGKHKDYREFSERLAQNQMLIQAQAQAQAQKLPNFPNQMHPFLNMPSQYQTPISNNTRPNLQIPQYPNPQLQQPQKHSSRSTKTSSTSNKSSNAVYAKNFQQKLYEEKMLKQHMHHHVQQSGSGFQHSHEASPHNYNTQYRHLSNYEQQHGRHASTKQQQQHVTVDKATTSKPKVVCKSFANIANNSHNMSLMKKLVQSSGGALTVSSAGCVSGGGGGAIDLSGSTAGAAAAAPLLPTPPPLPPSAGNKLKVKQHLIDPARLAKSADELPEVGSTTASIEEMQDAQKHLWHPLFGNQKGYASPWNWTTVTASGE